MNLMNKPIELQPRDLTSKSITRMKWLVLMALPGFPMITAIYAWLNQRELTAAAELTSGGKGALLVAVALALVSIICFIAVASNKKLNMIFRNRKHLDEWALAQKYEAESFAYRALGAVLFAGLMFGNSFTGSFNSTQITLTGLNLMSLMLLLPALYLAWNIKPLDSE